VVLSSLRATGPEADLSAGGVLLRGAYSGLSGDATDPRERRQSFLPHQGRQRTNAQPRPRRMLPHLPKIREPQAPPSRPRLRGFRQSSLRPCAPLVSNSSGMVVYWSCLGNQRQESDRHLRKSRDCGLRHHTRQVNGGLTVAIRRDFPRRSLRDDFSSRIACAGP
jgi:hypothetical protein